VCTDSSEILDHERGRWEDPIVAEIHAVRERLFEEAGASIEGLLAMLKASEAARGVRSVSRSPGHPDADQSEHSGRPGEAA
jgi:hypothetical protein